MMHIGLITLTDMDTAFDLANTLVETGQSVSLYLDQDSATRSNETPDQYIGNLYKMGIIPLSCLVNMYQFPRMRDPRSIFIVRKISQDMHNRGIELVHILAGPAEPWLAILACLVRDIPVVSTLIVPKANVGDPLKIWVEPLNRLLVLGSDLIIVNGKSLIDSVQKQYKIPSDQIVHIPLGARTSAVRWLRGNIHEQPATILFFGRVDMHKGLEFLIHAQPIITRQVPDARILIVGHGEELARCRTMIKDESVFEIHEGYIASDLMANFFARASLVVLPYISASTSGVLLTAYEFGKPVVATSVGALPEYVKDGVTGFLVPPANVNRLAEAIVRLLLDEPLRLQMGQNAKHWVNEENIKNIYKTLSAYEKAISLHRSK